MIHFKNSAGFTLIETLLALAVMAMMLTPLYFLQSSIVRNSYRYARYVERMMQAKLFLTDSAIAHLKDTKPLTLDKKINDPKTNLRFDMKVLSDGSALKKFKNVLVQQVTFSWDENRVRKTDALVTFVYRPEPPAQEVKK